MLTIWLNLQNDHVITQKSNLRKRKELAASVNLQKPIFNIENIDLTCKQHGVCQQPKTYKSIVNIPIRTNNNIQSKPLKTKRNMDKSNVSLNSVSTMARLALKRGGGRACIATHGSGCRHFGILDLHPMDRTNFLFYLKDDGWLNGKQCLNCGKNTNDITMDKSTKTYLRYCEMGLRSMKYKKNGNEEETALFNDHCCNMILCILCWNTKNTEYEMKLNLDNGNLKRRCSVRTIQKM